MMAQSEPGLDGVLLIDKPAGCSSFSVVRQIKQLIPDLRVGHTGTLDPMATGLLPMVIGEATKLTHWLMGGDKRYRATIQLGTSTDSLDREGQVVEHKPVPTLTQEQLQGCLREFMGHQMQTPPMFSALHHKGKRLYQWARKGVQVERAKLAVTVSRLDLLAFGADWLEIDVACSAGTYIRSLGADIAERLGTVGHLTALTRTEVCGWTLAQACTLAQATQERLPHLLIPLQDLLQRFKRVEVTPETCARLGNGQKLTREDLANQGVCVPDSDELMFFHSSESSPMVLARWRAQSKDKPAPASPTLEIVRVLRPQ
jgi:tRNA pseudouridine55 synthase